MTDKHITDMIENYIENKKEIRRHEEESLHWALNSPDDIKWPQREIKSLKAINGAIKRSIKKEIKNCEEYTIIRTGETPSINRDPRYPKNYLYDLEFYGYNCIFTVTEIDDVEILILLHSNAKNDLYAELIADLNNRDIK